MEVKFPWSCTHPSSSIGLSKPKTTGNSHKIEKWEWHSAAYQCDTAQQPTPFCLATKKSTPALSILKRPSKSKCSVTMCCGKLKMDATASSRSPRIMSVLIVPWYSALCKTSNIFKLGCLLKVYQGAIAVWKSGQWNTCGLCLTNKAQTAWFQRKKNAKWQVWSKRVNVVRIFEAKQK